MQKLITSPPEHDANREINVSIVYVLPQVPFDVHSSSLFQGFAPGTLESNKFIDTILTLPASILEFGQSRERNILARALGYNRYEIVPIESNILNYLPISASQPFWCFFSTPKTIEQVSDLIGTLQSHVLHFTAANVADVPHYSTISRQLVLDYVRNVLASLQQDSPSNLVERLRANEHKWHAESEKKELKNTAWGHNATHPGNITLMSLGFEFGAYEPLAGNNPETYASAICELAETVRTIREETFATEDDQVSHLGAPLGIIITAPTIYRSLYRSSSIWTAMNQQFGRLRGNFIRDFVARRTEFFSTVDAEKFEAILESPEVRATLSVRQEELRAYTGAVSVIAASDFCPVLRLPPGIEQYHQVLRDIGGCARGNSPHRRWKLCKLTKKLTDGLSTSLGSILLDELACCRGPAKIVSDIPLEWLPIDGIPLSIRNGTSRLPTTPGNSFFGIALDRRNVWIPKSNFHEILVIRSFDKADPLRDVLVNELQSLMNSTSLECQIQIKDVASLDEFVNALSDYNGSLLIFDGHGASAGDNDIAGLVIGSKVVNCWDLRGVVNIPPIVVLSACDTHPVDGSHASSANAFLASGAKTVLATLLPIEAHHAANYVSRLILRIGKFLGLVTRHAGAVRWSDVIVGFQRMAYISDLLLELSRRGLLQSAETRDRILYQSNMLINYQDSEWYEKTIRHLEDLGVIDRASLDEFISEHLPIPESLLYVQVGNPESIIIVDDQEPKSAVTKPSAQR